MGIIIGGDLVPTQRNSSYFIEKRTDKLLGADLETLLRDADYRIFNLEAPLTDAINPLDKCGPNLSAPIQCAAGYKAMGIDLVTLANNHILDQGVEGLHDTWRVLDLFGISHVGSGINICEAAKPFYFYFGEKRIGVYACAEHEFSVARVNRPGANPLDLLEISDHITSLKDNCDFVIVLYHGGNEHYRYPSPNLQRISRKMVEKGADLVVCQHSHCIGCEEKYLNGTIVYGQGNFLFDRSDNECWKTGLLINIDRSMKIEYIPVVKVAEVVRLANKIESKEILESFYQRSKEILNSDCLLTKYNEFVEKSIVAFMLDIICQRRSLIYKIINRISNDKFYEWLLDKRCKKQNRLNIINHIECESHRDVIIFGLTARKGKKSYEDKKTDIKND